MTPTQTLDSLREAVRLSPRDPALRRVLADAYLDDGDDREAEWHRDLAAVSEGALSPVGALASNPRMSERYLVELAYACPGDGLGIGPGFGPYVEAMNGAVDALGWWGASAMLSLLSKKIVTGKLWHVFPAPDHDPEGEGFHGLDTPPCEGEWVADVWDSSYWVVHPTEPACIDGWTAVRSALENREPGRILHADAAGISYLQHYGEDDTVTVRLYY